LGDVFQKKMRPTPKNIARMAKIRPIWSHLIGEQKLFFANFSERGKEFGAGVAGRPVIPPPRHRHRHSKAAHPAAAAHAQR
jgi:hypothetical protein